MLGITDLPTYVLGTVAIIMLPGPNSLFVLSLAARRGVAAGYRGAGGVFLGDTVLMVLSAAGVASLIEAYPSLFTALKYAGAGYLCFVGLGMVHGAWRRARATSAETIPAEATRAGTAPAAPNPFRRALVISLLNPKAILFFVSFFIQFVDPGYPYPALSFLVLGAIAQVVSAAYLTTLIFAGTYLAVQFQRRRRLAVGGTTAVGGLFVGFGVKLATTSF